MRPWITAMPLWGIDNWHKHYFIIHLADAVNAFIQTLNWGVLWQKQVSRVETNNYIPQIGLLWDVITIERSSCSLGIDNCCTKTLLMYANHLQHDDVIIWKQNRVIYNHNIMIHYVYSYSNLRTPPTSRTTEESDCCFPPPNMSPDKSSGTDEG